MAEVDANQIHLMVGVHSQRPTSQMNVLLSELIHEYFDFSGKHKSLVLAQNEALNDQFGLLI